GGRGGGHVLGGEDVLVRDGHAGQRAQLLTRGAALVDGPRLGQRGLPVHVQEGVDVAVDLADAVQVGRRRVDRTGLAARDGGAQLGGGEPDQVAAHHSSSPRICGTRNRWSSTAGAPDRACSGVRPGRTSSGRYTLVSGRACELGGMSPSAASCTLATAEMISSSWAARWSSSSSFNASRDNRARCATSSRVMADMNCLPFSDVVQDDSILWPPGTPRSSFRTAPRIHSSASPAASGGAKYRPCAARHPRARTSSAAPALSTPSATARIPSEPTRVIAEATMVRPSASSSTRRTKEPSI